MVFFFFFFFFFFDCCLLGWLAFVCFASLLKMSSPSQNDLALGGRSDGKTLAASAQLREHLLTEHPVRLFCRRLI